jgi:hypothetical protein
LQTGVVTNVIVDTFTISEPFGYEFYQGDSSYNQNYDDMVFDVLHYKYERVEADLFVSPDGDDNNSGLTGGEPLRTLNHALQIISADAERPRTIYLADGIYSSLINEQRFPVSMRAYVSLIGESRENTIIDLSIGNQGFIVDLFSEMGYEIKNLTIRNGNTNYDDLFFSQGINLRNSSNYSGPVLLESLLIVNNDIAQFIIVSNMNITLRNIIFNDNTYSTEDVTCFLSFDYNKYQGENRNVLIENCLVNNNELGLLNLVGLEFAEPENLRIDIINSEFSDNVSNTNHTWLFTEGLSITGVGAKDLNVINCTFAENFMYGISPGNAPVKVFFGVEAELINNIFYNNSDHSVIIDGEPGFETILNMNYNIMENGIDGVLATGPYVLNWDNETTWDVDPLFMNEGDYPYSLQEGSPAIDMGTLNLPEGVVLPEYDLAGNPRILGNGIDLGAYEYNPFSQPPVSTDGEPGDPGLVYYPNPVRLNKGREAVYIAFRSSRGDKESKLGIFNIRGQKVWEQDIETGTGGIRWDCSDMNGRKLAAGIYFLRISQDGRFLEQGKLTILK